MPLRVLSVLTLLLAAVRFPAAAQQNAPPRYPPNLKIVLDYSKTISEPIGTPNTPQCRNGGWRAQLTANLVKKEASPYSIVYAVQDGKWTAGGDCKGTMEFEQGDRMCSWTRTDGFNGSGNFPAEFSSAELAIYPGMKSYVFAFNLHAPGSHNVKWEPYCDRPGAASTGDYDFPGAFTGSVSFVNGSPKFSAGGDTAWTNDNIGGEYRSHAVAMIYDKLKAVAGGPYTIERGQTVQLDGSGSLGAIEEYEWALQPNGDCPTGTKKDVKLKGKQVSFKALCPLTATLTVSGADARDSEAAAVAVRARKWQTPFEHAAEGRMTDVGKPVMIPTGRDSAGKLEYSMYELVGGENVSVFDESAPANQLLHPLSTNGSWNGSGYTIEQVNDDGPFAGIWFVSKYTVEVKRKTLVNQYLLPDGPLVNGKSIYLENERDKLPIAEYLAAIRNHEGMSNGKGVLGHSGLFEKALRADDPGLKLEKLAESDSSAVQQKADEALHAANIRMCTEGRDPLPPIWGGNLKFPILNSGGWAVGWADVGGDTPQYKAMPPCT